MEIDCQRASRSGHVSIYLVDGNNIVEFVAGWAEIVRETANLKFKFKFKFIKNSA